MTTYSHHLCHHSDKHYINYAVILTDIVTTDIILIIGLRSLPQTSYQHTLLHHRPYHAYVANTVQ